MAMIWYGKKVEARIWIWTRKQLLEAALLLEHTIKTSMKGGGRTPGGGLASIGIERVGQFSGKRGKAGKMSSASYRDTGTGKRVRKSEIEKRMKKIGAHRSKPGEPPRAQTGRLRASITHWLHPKLSIARVGTNVKYGKFLELGTRRMKPRPFMLPALAKSHNIIKAKFEKGMPV